jgi:hypothetical protein
MGKNLNLNIIFRQIVLGNLSLEGVLGINVPLLNAGKHIVVNNMP